MFASFLSVHHHAKGHDSACGLTVNSGSHEVDIQKNSDATQKLEQQRNMDEQKHEISNSIGVYNGKQLINVKRDNMSDKSEKNKIEKTSTDLMNNEINRSSMSITPRIPLVST